MKSEGKRGKLGDRRQKVEEEMRLPHCVRNDGVRCVRLLESLFFYMSCTCTSSPIPAAFGVALPCYCDMLPAAPVG